jgi:misacylated tRNA(Ala) deacylase
MKTKQIMEETELLYIKNSYLKEFYATVIKSGPRFVILNRTSFYPEGGGQPSDTGKIAEEKNIFKVRKVMKRGNQIFHYLDGNISEDVKVRGVIDWEPRFWNMRRHSAEHLLTGLFEASGSGLKVFSSLKQLDFKPSDLNEIDVINVQKKFNNIIDADLYVQISYVKRNELGIKDDTRKLEFLANIPKSVKKIRMVKIGEHAITFCMGTHVKTTKDIGKLKGLRLESKKKKRKIVYFKLAP